MDSDVIILMDLLLLFLTAESNFFFYKSVQDNVLFPLYFNAFKVVKYDLLIQSIKKK